MLQGCAGRKSRGPGPKSLVLGPKSLGVWLGWLGGGWPGMALAFRLRGRALHGERSLACAWLGDAPASFSLLHPAFSLLFQPSTFYIPEARLASSCCFQPPDAVDRDGLSWSSPAANACSLDGLRQFLQQGQEFRVVFGYCAVEPVGVAQLLEAASPAVDVVGRAEEGGRPVLRRDGASC